MPTYKFHFYKDVKGEWRWRLKARNGKIVADSGEGYATRSGAHKAGLRLLNCTLVVES